MHSSFCLSFYTFSRLCLQCLSLIYHLEKLQFSVWQWIWHELGDGKNLLDTASLSLKARLNFRETCICFLSLYLKETKYCLFSTESSILNKNKRTTLHMEPIYFTPNISKISQMHNGFFSSMFWVFLSFMMCFKHHQGKNLIRRAEGK